MSSAGGLIRFNIDREVEIKDEYKPVIRLLSWIPSIMLLVVILSMAAEWLISAINPTAGAEVALKNALTLIFDALKTLFPNLNLSGSAILALIAFFILMAAAFSWHTPVGVSIGMLVLGIFAYFVMLFLMPFFAFSGIKIPYYGGGLEALLVAGLHFMVGNILRVLDWIMSWASHQVPTLIALSAVMSALAALSMWIDKRRSKVQGAWRMPEKALIRYAVLGGGPGVLIAAMLFHHKTRHYSFLAWVAATTFASFYILFGGVLVGAP